VQKLKHHPCEICHKNFTQKELYPLALMRNFLVPVLHKKSKGVDLSGYVCLKDYQELLVEHVQTLLKKGKQPLSPIERAVIKSIQEEAVLSQDMNKKYTEKLTFGQRLADKVSEFGGSWSFIILFFMMISIWMFINEVPLFHKPYDPYPYILLNLVLSCLAAVQAPIILMSQNRKADRDRREVENDYSVNLKAELEIRHLNERIDHLTQLHGTK
jgi:uncharacterized membrane protein